jgi:mRNA-degrading endonuclease RelE of RelBE toxin-antitoxin system
MNSIEWTRKALKDLKGIDRQQKVTIINAVDSLTDFTNHPQVKRLSNHDYGYRLRVGNYRVLFNHSESVKIVSIERVRKRDERTY